MGIVGCPLLVADEPGSWEVVGGELMHDAIQTAQGKPGSALRVVYIGTLAPSRAGWWHDLVRAGSTGSTHVSALQGDPDRWDLWPEIRRVNPLTAVSATFRRKLIEERDAGRRDSRLRARFLSYRLNVPTGDESTMLVTVSDWQRVEARPVPERVGRPVVGVDLGGGRAWSATVAIWRNGRIEAVAVAPGVPEIDAQERRDRVQRGFEPGSNSADANRLLDRLVHLRRPMFRKASSTVYLRIGSRGCVGRDSTNIATHPRFRWVACQVRAGYAHDSTHARPSPTVGRRRCHRLHRPPASVRAGRVTPEQNARRCETSPQAEKTPLG